MQYGEVCGVEVPHIANQECRRRNAFDERGRSTTIGRKFRLLPLDCICIQTTGGSLHRSTTDASLPRLPHPPFPCFPHLFDFLSNKVVILSLAPSRLTLSSQINQISAFSLCCSSSFQ